MFTVIKYIGANRRHILASNKEIDAKMNNTAINLPSSVLLVGTRACLILIVHNKGAVIYCRNLDNKCALGVKCSCSARHT